MEIGWLKHDAVSKLRIVLATLVLEWLFEIPCISNLLCLISSVKKIDSADGGFQYSSHEFYSQNLRDTANN